MELTGANKDKSICLHSYTISFVHPVKNELIKLKCDFPKNDIWKFTSL